MKIKENPLNAGIPMEDIDELASSIQDLGLLEPITVYEEDESGLCEIVSGHRRFRAVSEVLKQPTINCIKRKRPSDERTRFRMHADSNVQTRQHSVRYWIAEISHADSLLEHEGFKGTVDEKVQAVSSLLGNGMSVAQIYRMKGIAKMNPRVVELERYRVSAKSLYAAVSLSPEQQERLADSVCEYIEQNENSEKEIPASAFLEIVKNIKNENRPAKTKKKKAKAEVQEKPCAERIDETVGQLLGLLHQFSDENGSQECLNMILQIKYKLRVLEDNVRF